MTTQSQRQIVLEHLKSGKPITQKVATDKYGIARLASRVTDLKQSGHTVNVTKIKVLNRSRKWVYVAQYSLGVPKK